jgi:hypothetical protein
MSLLELVEFLVILCLTIYFIRVVPLPSPRPPSGPSYEWVRAVLTCVVVLVAIVWLVEHGHGFFLRS